MAFIELGRREPGIGEKLGTSLGTGLSAGLQQLAQDRIANLQRQQTAQGLQALKFTPQQAQQLSMLPQPILQQVVKQQQQQQAYSRLGEMLGMGGVGSPRPQQVPGGQQMQQQPGMEEAVDYAQESVPERSPSELQNLLLSQGIDPSTASKMAEIHAKDIKEARESRKERREVTAEARKILAPYRARSEAGANDKRDYTLLGKLAKTGMLRSGIQKQLMSLVGVDKWNENVPTQIAEKLIGRLKQNVGGAFGPGTRITNYLESVFQQSLPTLWNSAEGIQALSEMNALLGDLNIESEKIAEHLLTKYKNEIPLDFETQVRNALSDKRDAAEAKIEKIAMDAVAGNKKIRKTRGDQPKTGEEPQKFAAGQKTSKLPDAKSFAEGEGFELKSGGKVISVKGQWILEKDGKRQVYKPN